MDIEFWETYRALVPIGQDPTDPKTLRMRDDIVQSHFNLTKHVASKMIKNMPAHVDREDLEGYAALGLMRAVQKYNHTMNVPFEAYAIQSMRSVIMDGIRDQDWAPRSLRRKQREIDRAEELLKHQLERVPTEDEVATQLGITAQEVSYTKYRSENAAFAYIQECTEILNQSNNVATEELEMAAQIRQTLVQAVRKLPFREAVVIALHYFAGKKLADVAKLIRVSEVKAGTIHTEAVMHIWQSLDTLANGAKA